jgi:hypothetical protein
MSIYDEHASDRIDAFFSPSDASVVSKEVKDKMRDAARRFSRITGERLNDLYANLSRDEGRVDVKDLWLISERYVMLVEDFDKETGSESVKFFSARKRINQVQITTEQYSFEGEESAFSENSKIAMRCITTDNILIEREATGPYCPKLARVVRLWVLPNLV